MIPMSEEEPNSQRYPNVSGFKETSSRPVEETQPQPPAQQETESGPAVLRENTYRYTGGPREGEMPPEENVVADEGQIRARAEIPREEPRFAQVRQGYGGSEPESNQEPIPHGSWQRFTPAASQMQEVPRQAQHSTFAPAADTYSRGHETRETHYDDVPESIRKTQHLAHKLIGEVKTAVLGKAKVLELVCCGLLSNGNILFEDFPGLAKTLIAHSFSKAINCVYKRVQFTPDLLPADITGTYVFNRKNSEFDFKKGPIFTNILLADEINRAPPKTQAALLEAMEEKQVTVEGTTHTLQSPFHVIATQNPIEYEGTYPLPEAQLDRFLMKLEVGYPDANTEISILNHRRLRARDAFDIRPVTTAEEFTQMQKNVEKVFIDDSLIAYIVSITRETRRHPEVKIGASPRGALAMFKLARSMAVLQGRDYVIPDDVKKIVVPALEHRLILKPEPKIKGVKPRDVVIEIVENIPVPLA